MRTIVSRNFIYLRRSLGHTQQSFADALGLKRSLVGAYEEGRATPRLEVLDQLSQMSGHSLRDLLHTELAPEGGAKEVKKLGRPRVEKTVASMQPAKNVEDFGTHIHDANTALPDAGYLSGQTIRTLAVSVDVSGAALVDVVPLEQMGAYAQRSAEAAYLSTLPKAALPWLAAGEPGRIFEVEVGRRLICRHVRNWYSLQPAGLYLVVWDRQVGVGTVANYLSVNGSGRAPHLVLTPERGAAETIAASALTEIWEVAERISHSNGADADQRTVLERLERIEASIARLA